MCPLRRLGSILLVALFVLAGARDADGKGKKSTDDKGLTAKKKDPTGEESAPPNKRSSTKGKGDAKASSGKSRGSAKGGQSIGAPNAGKLAGSIRLRGSRFLRQREGAHSWGLSGLVHLLERASVRVARKHKGSVMLAGDLSGRTGGPLEGHRSHQSGRDADIGFYVLNSRGKSVNVRHFVAFDSNGKGRELPWATFDEARNWTLVETLIEDTKTDVRYLFINNGLRARLLAYAARTHVPKDVIARAAAAMMNAREVDLHDDHLHVRIPCPESMREGCTEEAGFRSDVAKASRASDVDIAEDKASGGGARPGATGPQVDAKAAEGDAAAAPGRADGAEKDSP